MARRMAGRPSRWMAGWLAGGIVGRTGGPSGRMVGQMVGLTDGGMDGRSDGWAEIIKRYLNYSVRCTPPSSLGGGHGSWLIFLHKKLNRWGVRAGYAKGAH